MRAVVLAFHPALRQSRVNGAWCAAAESFGIEVRDLYAMYPNGQPDVVREQSAILSASLLIFQHPFNWYSCPWLMKRWIDEVLTHGWAYGEQACLKGKTWLSAISVGAGAEEYTAAGTRKYSVPEFLTPFERTAAFVQMDWATPFIQFGSGYISDRDLQASAEAFVERIRTLTRVPSEPPISYNE